MTINQRAKIPMQVAQVSSDPGASQGARRAIEDAPGSAPQPIRPGSEDAVRGVARGTAELAVIGENTAAVGLHTRVCDVDERVLLVPPGHPLAPADARQAVGLSDLLNHGLVAFGRTTPLTRQLAAAAETVQRPLRLRAQVRSLDAMGRRLAAGQGLAVLPRRGALPYAHAHARALGLRTAPLHGMQTERLLLALRNHQAPSPAASALV